MNSDFGLKMLFLSMKKYLIYILIITFICTGIAAAYTFTVPTVYSVSATFYSLNTAPNYDYSNSNLVSAQQKLVNDYIEIIKSDKMLTVVKNDLKEDGYKTITVSDIRAKISAKQIDDTSAFTVTVSGTDTEEIYDIIASICDNVSEIINGTQQRDNSIDVLSDKKEIKPVKVSPSIVKNILTGFVIGLLSSIILFLIIAYYDRTVSTEEDLKKRFDLPVIGVIPSWVSNRKGD